MHNSFSPLGGGLHEGSSTGSPPPGSRAQRYSVLESIEPADMLLEFNLRQLRTQFSNVVSALREPNIHRIDVPFAVPDPSELLVDILRSKAANSQGNSLDASFSRGLTGLITLLVCTTADDKISAVSITVTIGSLRFTMQELQDCGLLLPQSPTLRLITVVSRVWRSLGCVESPRKQAERQRRGQRRGGGQGKLPPPPAITRAEVASFVTASSPMGSQTTVTESHITECFSSSATGMSWLGEARAIVQSVEDANEERASQLAGLEAQLAVLRAEMQEKVEEFREKSARREGVRRVLAPEVLKLQLEQAACMARHRGETLAHAWREGKGQGARNETFLREYIDAMASMYAMEAKCAGLDTDNVDGNACT